VASLLAARTSGNMTERRSPRSALRQAGVPVRPPLLAV